MADDALTRRKHELAHRIQLMLAAFVSPTGAPFGYPEVSEALEQSGIDLSRKRWNYLVRGNGSLVTDSKLLATICDFFGVDRAYLLVWGPTEKTEFIEAQLELVRVLRVHQVTELAARVFDGHISTEGLRSVAATIDSMNARDDNDEKQ